MIKGQTIQKLCSSEQAAQMNFFLESLTEKK